MSAIAFTILGEPASKANSRVLSTIGPKDNRRTILRKSDKALEYEKDALRQIPPRARVRLEGPVRATMTIYYASERPDLDESVILDVLQDRYAKDPVTGERRLVQHGVYRNDRQVRSKRIDWALDPANPRAEIIVEPLQPQQVNLIPQQEPEPLAKKPKAKKDQIDNKPPQAAPRETTADPLEDDCPF